MKERRTNLWIDPRRQSKFALHLIIITLISCLITGISLYTVAWLNFRTLESLGLRSILEVRETFLLATLVLIGAYLLFIVALFGIILWVAKRISHRITGPIFSLKRRLLHLKAGDLSTPFKIRKTDFLHSLEYEFEHLRAHIQTSTQKRSQDLNKTKELSSQIQDPSIKEGFSNLLEKHEHEKAA